MRSNFELNKGQGKIFWPGRVSKHDLVYLSPPEYPMQGLPLGNGDVVALCWCEGTKLILAVMRSMG